MNKILAKLKETKSKKKLVIDDINRPIYLAIFGTSIYGKSARDEEVMEIIIGQRDDPMVVMRQAYDDRVNEYGSGIKKVNGVVRDPNGFIVLVPKR